MADYFSFEDVQNELHLDEDELKRMVSEGELRAFRDENKMKFRKDDVESLRKTHGTEPTIVLPGEGDSGGGEGTILDLDASDTAPPPEDTAVPSIDFGDTNAEGTAVEESGSETGDTTGITEEMVFEDSDLKVHTEEGGQGLGSSESSETFVDESSDTGGVTEPLQLQADGGGEEAGDTVAEEEAAAKPKKKMARAPAMAAAAPAGPPGSPAMTVVLLVAAAILGVVGWCYYDLVRIVTSPGYAKSDGLPQTIRELVKGKESVVPK
ncbi:MAG: helix-turn-helix domain-containing protein [Planctomycetota bacterium]